MKTLAAFLVLFAAAVALAGTHLPSVLIVCEYPGGSFSGMAGGGAPWYLDCGPTRYWFDDEDGLYHAEPPVSASFDFPAGCPGPFTYTNTPLVGPPTVIVGTCHEEDR